MKEEQLFIGAWVYNAHHKKNIQITPYDFFTHRHDENGVQHLKHHSIPRTGNDLYPIPITPEILEKNGFSRIDIEGNIKQSETGGFYVWYEIDSNILGIEKDTSTYAGESSETLMKLRIFNVHELQAAMRLCGIDKEIVL